MQKEEQTKQQTYQQQLERVTSKGPSSCPGAGAEQGGQWDSLLVFAPPCATQTRVLHLSSVRGMGFHTLPFETPNSINLSVFTFPAHSHSFTAAFS